MKNKLIFAAIALPFLVLCLLIVRAEYHVKSGDQWMFELQGYDPRDLLRGHYLQFNILYDWDKEKNECSSGINCCLCLTKNSSLEKTSVAPKVHKSSCTSAKNQCDGYILSSKQNVLNRYYIPEKSAKRAESLLIKARAKQQAYLQVSINKNGEPAIVDLIIDNQSINELLKIEDPSD
jgi:uncharacterized membrane-anchored protein